MRAKNSFKPFSMVFAMGAILAGGGCGGGSGSGASTGVLSVHITDAPVDGAEHVYVQFSGLELQGNGQHLTLYYCQDPADSTKTIVRDTSCNTNPAPKQIDLLALNSGLADTLLGAYTLPAGHYNWMRLMVDTVGVHDSYIVVSGGADHELTIPSADLTGLKLNRGFDVPAGGSANFTLDFDLRKSVHVTGMGEYILRPTLRIADNSMVGAISGTVDAALVTTGCLPSVYVYQGSGVTPDDIDNIAADPITTAYVKLDSADGLYKYKAGFLEAGNYTVAYTCDTAADDPDADNSLAFSGTTSVSVTANTTTVHNF